MKLKKKIMCRRGQQKCEEGGKRPSISLWSTSGWMNDHFLAHYGCAKKKFSVWTERHRNLLSQLVMVHDSNVCRHAWETWIFQLSIFSISFPTNIFVRFSVVPKHKISFVTFFQLFLSRLPWWWDLISLYITLMWSHSLRKYFLKKEIRFDESDSG